jgi:sodium-dependent dicarboxylate transporter 2/3/5
VQLTEKTDSLPGRNFSLASVGLLAGPVSGLFVYLLLPDSYTGTDGILQQLPLPARATAGVATLMAMWWMTEAIPVYATALLPLALFPLFGISDMHSTALAYGNEIIYLFLGGFILALSLERWGLHRRIAINALATVGSNPHAIIGAFMAVSAFLSMWVTNTAATIMLLPVALSIIRLLPDSTGGSIDASFGLCLLLGIAYASSIGGMGTIIGTAPNVFAVSFISENLGRQIGFIEWMRFALPLVILFVPLAWVVLTRVAFPLTTAEIPEAAAILKKERASLSPWSRGEISTLCVFLVTAAAWIFRPLLNELEFGATRPFEELSDPGVAVMAALLLFLIPVDFRRREFLMNWETALRLPWGLLILFGGGLALAAALVTSGFSQYLANLSGGLGGLPAWAIILAVTATVVFLTELTSNTATTATIIPILLAVSAGLNLQPLLLIMPAVFAASCAFMLPVATPPNAIVFGSNLIGIKQMSRAGFWLNLAAIALITIATYAIIMPALGVLL